MNLAGKINKDIYLLNYQAGWTPYWCYLQVDKLKQPLFEKQLAEGGRIDLNKMGNIIFMGVGEEPAAYYANKIANNDYVDDLIG